MAGSFVSGWCCSGAWSGTTTLAVQLLVELLRGRDMQTLFHALGINHRDTRRGVADLLSMDGPVSA